MKFTVASIFFTILLLSLSVNADFPPRCFYEPTTHVFQPGEKYIHLKPNGWCLSQATCNDDYTVSVKECSPLLCPADKALVKEEFPDCCCGDY